MLVTPACGPALTADVPPSPSAEPVAAVSGTAASASGTAAPDSGPPNPTSSEAPPKAECDAFMDLIGHTTTMRAAIQRSGADAKSASTWASEAATLADLAKKLRLTHADLVMENANLATRLGDLAKDLKSLADTEKSADPSKKSAAQARVLNTSEQVEVISREPVARCGGEPRKLQSTPGRIEPAKIQTTVRDHFGDLRKCYEAGLKRDPKLTGLVSIRFVIGRDGKVASAENGAASPVPLDAIAPPSNTTAAPMSDRKVIDCVLASFRTLQFPRPEGGIVTVVYPIVFAPSP